jgi:hypothetical protein
MISRGIATQVVDVFMKTDRSGNVSDAMFNRYKFYKYIGKRLPTSRCFCVQRKHKIFHEEEIRMWGNNPGLWFECGGRGKAGGMMADTTEQTIWQNLGGWECKDYLMGIPVRLVPQSVKDRVVNFL